MKTLSSLILFSIFLNFSFAQQNLEIIPDEILVRLEKGTDHQFFIHKYLDEYDSLSFKKVVSKRLDLYLFKHQGSASIVKKDIQSIRNLPLVEIVGFNFKIEQRSTAPNDPLFEEQWHHDLIDAPEAWDITTGGLTYDNQEIVVAIVEGGDIDHIDVQGNIWVNNDEIPNDNIDNDNNGYIDDYRGVNVMDSTDNPIIDSHSTSVMGLVGAKGNNSLGVTGVNWDIKMMIVSHNLDFDQIIESYEYVYEKRKRYNDTNGTEGAFVVVTNSSFGVNNAFPEDNPFYPMWCEMYDNMGSVGILSAGAITNSLNKNIDLDGDMPATCSSEYLITVTNTDMNDELAAGYGQTLVDMSAPGKNSYTLKPNDEFGTFGGTSASTPHVSGAIGLLYSLPCEGLMEQATAFPAETALLVKQTILDGVDKIDALEGKTVTEGRLNIFNSLKLLQNEFGSEKGSLSISKIFPNPSITGSINIEYRTPDITAYEINIYNAMGQLLYTEEIPEFCAAKTLNLPTNDWPSGVYIVTLGNSSDFVSSKFTLNIFSMPSWIATEVVRSAARSSFK